MQCIVKVTIWVVDVDTVLSKDSHDLSMAMLGSNPEGIQAILVLLVDVDHFVLKHETYEFIATECNMISK